MIFNDKEYKLEYAGNYLNIYECVYNNGVDAVAFSEKNILFHTHRRLWGGNISMKEGIILKYDNLWV